MNCVQIGEVTEGDTLRYFMNGQRTAEVSADSLVLGGGAPVYERDYKEPTYIQAVKAFNQDDIAEPTNLVEVAKSLLGHVNVASKDWVTDQYDSMVGTINMGTNSASDAGIVNIKGSRKCMKNRPK